jgi:hypothetical protein
MPVFRNGGSYGEQVRNIHTSTVNSVGTTAVAIAPVPDQKFVRLIPLSGRKYFFGFSSSVDANTGEKFWRNSAVTILTSAPVWIIGSTSGTTQTVTASAGLVTEASDTINITGHGFADNTLITYSSTGTVITGLTSGSQYFVRDSAANSFKLALIPGGTAIDISSDGVGTQVFNPNHDVLVEQGV